MEVTEHVRLLERMSGLVLNRLGNLNLANFKFKNHHASKICPMTLWDAFANDSHEAVLEIIVEVSTKNATEKHQLERMESHMIVGKTWNILIGCDSATQGASQLLQCCTSDTHAEVLILRAKH